MPIQVICSNDDCQQRLKVKDELAGKKVKCPKCGTAILVPAPEPKASGADPDETGATRVVTKRPAASVDPAPGGEAAQDEDEPGATRITSAKATAPEADDEADGTRIVSKPSPPPVDEDGLGATRPPSGRSPEESPEAQADSGDGELARLLGKRTPAFELYERESELARGGMGAILLCHDRSIGRPVAMKVMHPGVAGSQGNRLRFLEEAQVTGQLEHPNIVPIHELGKDGEENLYFTMKLVKGRSLGQILAAMRQTGDQRPETGDQRRNGHGDDTDGQSRDQHAVPITPTLQDSNTPSLTELLHVFLKVCDGMAFAHSKGVIHRDLKPDNIMVGDFGEVLVMDWGIAKVLQRGVRNAERGREGDGEQPMAEQTNVERSIPNVQRSTGEEGQDGSALGEADTVRSVRTDTDVALTMDGTVAGTLAYMPPEQAEGAIQLLDHRSDIYSLGAVLYEILTLARPVEGKSQNELLLKVVEGKIVPPDQRTPERQIPKELSAVVMKAMAEKQEDRYQSVKEFSRDISLFLEGRAVSAKEDTFVESFVKLVKRNKGVSTAIAAAAVVLFAVTTVFMVRLKAQRDRAVANEQRALAGERRAREAEEGRRADALAASERAAYEALAAANQGRWAEADSRAQSALGIMRDGPWGYYAHGIVAWKKDDYAEAEKQFRQALERDTGHQASKDALVQVLNEAGEIDKALAALEVDGEHSDWRVLKAAGESLYRAGRYRKAAEALAKALDAMEQMPPPEEGDWAKLVDLAPSLLTSGRYPEAKAAGEKALKLLAGKSLSSVESRVKEFLQKAEDGLGPLRDETESLHAEAVAWIRCEGFYDSIARLSAEEQRREVGRKLEELHGSGVEWWRHMAIEDGEIRRLEYSAAKLRFLQPVAGLPLKTVTIGGTRVHSLDALWGMPLVRVNCYSSPVRDLSPLAGTPLREFGCGRTLVEDLRPLKGMPLEVLYIFDTQVADLSPLAGMPLTELECGGTKVADLSPLRGMSLEKLDCRNLRTFSDLQVLAGMPLRELTLFQTGVSDLSPLRGLPLQSLSIGGTAVTDLTPLKGMALTYLDIFRVRADDLSPLRGMPLEGLRCTPRSQHQLEDLGKILSEMPLRELRLDEGGYHSLEPLRGLQLTQLMILLEGQSIELDPLRDVSLRALNLRVTRVSGLAPLMGARLKSFSWRSPHDADLSPLKGSPLEWIDLYQSSITDLTPLEGLALRFLRPPPKEQLTPESLKVIEKLKKGVGCQIQW